MSKISIVLCHVLWLAACAETVPEPRTPVMPARGVESEPVATATTEELTAGAETLVCDDPEDAVCVEASAERAAVNLATLLSAARFTATALFSLVPPSAAQRRASNGANAMIQTFGGFITFFTEMVGRPMQLPERMGRR